MSGNSAIDRSSLEQLRHALVVSCQAAEGEPLNAPEHIAALALSAINGGARGLRLEGIENIEFLRPKVQLPIIGLTKAKDIPEKDRQNAVYITPTFEDAAALAKAGANLIALDATERPRPNDVKLKDLIARIHDQLQLPVWADVATLKEGLHAVAVGADVISTTLSGYTKETATRYGAGPDLDLLEELCEKVKTPIALEGQVWYTEEVTEAFRRGAYTVVVGSAITRPQLITRRFVKAIPGLSK